MLRAFALTLAVAIMMASGFGFAPPLPGAVALGVGAEVPATALKSDRLDLIHT